MLGAKKRVTCPVAVSSISRFQRRYDDQVLRFKGKGARGPGGESGDALVEIRVRPHAEFRRQDDDILLEIPITLDEAVLGASRGSDHDGRVQLTIPKGTSSGKTFRLKGKGVKSSGKANQAISS